MGTLHNDADSRTPISCSLDSVSSASSDDRNTRCATKLSTVRNMKDIVVAMANDDLISDLALPRIHAIIDEIGKTDDLHMNVEGYHVAKANLATTEAVAKALSRVIEDKKYLGMIVRDICARHRA